MTHKPWPTRTRRSLAAQAVVRGFTLIEVLVSLVILSVLAMTAWKGVDAISTARQVADDNLKQTLRLQSVTTQMDADLAQIMDTLIVTGMQFDGAHLRMTRRAAEGMQVVVWYLERGRLLRWASPVTSRYGELQKYWMSSYLLRGSEPGTLVALKGVEQWQVYCFRGGAMSNCQSTGNVQAQPAAGGAAGGGALAQVLREQLPQAVRSQLALGEGSGFAGVLTRDIMIAPQAMSN